MIEQFYRVLAEPGDSAQAAGDGGPGTAAGFQVTGEALDVGPAAPEQPQVVLLAPVGVLAQVRRVRLAGQAGVAARESCQGKPFRLGEHRLDMANGGGCGRSGRGAPPGFGRGPGRLGLPWPQRRCFTSP